ncbi:hypothetical protein ACSRUE_17720 [Sorangium sp. KYC3313]|uniref:hypothetical protein n=1 Tax=Sorangium sp. KYC3313 TaxID=3449740 RepID=UPI003F89A319
MPRMIFWNVNVFSEDKFFIRERERKRDEEEAWGEDAAQNYLKVLFNAITANNPDFIVIVEARPGSNTGEGTLLSDGGAMQLLRYLRANDSAQWALVPPVISGLGNAGEGIAVYFRRTATLYFTGPWRWPGGAGPAAPGVMVGDYRSQYQDAFSNPVDNRTVPGGNNLYNAGEIERKLAGQWRYFGGGGGGGGGGAGAAPAPIGFGGDGTRSPFRTTFYDSATTPGRNYSILACHAAPSQLPTPATAPSTLATQAIGNLHEVQNIGANETIVVVGDFNVSLFVAAATAVAYAPFAANYVQVINTVGGAALPAGYPARGYLSTHIVSDNHATPSNARGYPAFGYMSELDAYGQYDSIDNAFVRNGAVASATIANLITGAPYTAVMPVPAGMPPGTLTYASALSDPKSLNSPKGYDPAGDDFDDETEWFLDIVNYGLVYGVSDHLPLVFDF